MAIAHIIAGTSITVVADFRPHVISKDHPNYERIKALCGDMTANEGDVLPLLDVPKAISEYTDGAVYVKDGRLFHNGAEVRTSLGQKILEFVRSGKDDLAQSLKALLHNVSQNPDPRVQTDLWDWLVAAELPVTGDGYVLAWKAVTLDYRSLHAPNDTRFDHRVGNRVWQPRDECDADPNKTCSRGLHFAAASYLSNYATGGSRIVVVKIHPKDIVAFPTDYHLKKGRACDYVIVGEVPHDKVKDYYPQGVPVYTGFDAPKPAAPAFKPQVGQIWKTRSGKRVVVTNVDDRYVYSAGYYPAGASLVSYEDGSQWRSSRQDERDFVKLMPDFPLEAADFETGQKWVTRAGQIVTLTVVDHIRDRISYSGGDNHTVFARNGRGNSVGTHPADLVFQLDYKAPAKVTNEMIQPGAVFRNRKGQLVTISSVYSLDGPWGYAYDTEGKAYCAYRKQPELAGRNNTILEKPEDLVRLVTPAKPKAERLNGFAVGQVWKTRAGQQVSISSIKYDTGRGFPIRTHNGATYAKDGRYYTDRDSSVDLVTLVTDVH